MFRIQGCSKAVLTFSLAHFGLKMQKAERHNLYRRLKQLEQYKKQNQSYCVPDVDCQYCTEHTVPTKLCSKRCHAVATASLATITSVVIPCESEKLFLYHIIIPITNKRIKKKRKKSYLRLVQQKLMSYNDVSTDCLKVKMWRASQGSWILSVPCGL